MNTLTSGELFAGVGGLGMAVDEVFGSRPAWFCEFDAAPSKVLAHHFPDVPNFGDVTKVDFTKVPHTNIRCGGFPCQDVSLGGRRAGMKDGTRSGLWSEFARSIAEDRPDWVVIENVRGLLSADASGGNLEPCPWCVGDESGEHALRALGAVLGDLAELGFDAEWIGLRAADIGAPHGRFRVFILAWPSAHTRDATRDGEWPREELGKGDSAAHLTLLPTPGAYQPGGSQHPEKRRGGGHALNLQDVIEYLPLLPTPAVGNATGGNAQRGGDRADEKLLPGLAVEAAGGRLMPTPRATRGGSSTEMSYAMGGERADDERPQGVVTPGADWGPYTSAIHRWGSVIDRPAPSPVRNDGKGGKPRLNPELTEWMMGWPAGWVTAADLALSRAEQLKACGNGVVPQQAAFALRLLLARPGVPAITRGLAA